MDIIISNASDKPIYDQIYSQVKAAILKGTLKEGHPLPSIRALARDLKISVITTKRAFDDLERDGYIHSVQGKGSFVAPSNPQMRREELLKEIENLFERAYALSLECGLSHSELVQMLRLTAEGD